MSRRRRLRTALLSATMSSSCSHLLSALKDCLLHSDCVLKQGHLPSECLRDHTDELPESCKALRQATFECKRGMVRRPIALWLCVLPPHLLLQN